MLRQLGAYILLTSSCIILQICPGPELRKRAYRKRQRKHYRNIRRFVCLPAECIILFLKTNGTVSAK